MTIKAGFLTELVDDVTGYPFFKNLVSGADIGFFKLTSALTPALVAANTTAEQTFTVNGLVVGDVVTVNKPTAQAGLGIVGARVSAANTLAITFSNNTAAGITPTAAETYIVGVIR